MLNILTKCAELTLLLLNSEVQFLKGLQTFNAVISVMFGKELQPKYTHLLKAYVCSFLEPNEKFGVLFIHKVHGVLQHFEEFVALTGKGGGTIYAFSAIPSFMAQRKK